MKPELIARHYVPDLPAATQPTDDVLTTINDLRDAFNTFDEWTERYQYIIDLGRALPPLPAQLQTEEHRLHGCQSAVWLGVGLQDGHLYIYATSDAAIVSGLIALVSKVYSGRTPAEIVATSPEFLRDLGLFDHLSPTRNNGLHALVEAVQTVAQHAQKQVAA